MRASVRKFESIADRRLAWANIESYREEANKVELEKRNQERIEMALKDIPFRFRNKTFADFEASCDKQKEIKQIAECYAATFNDRLKEGASLIFLGKPGTGKTLLAFMLYQTLINKHFRAVYQPSLSFLRLLQEKQFESYQAYQQQLKYYEELPFLIIDEVTEGCGKNAYPADWERHLLRVIIDTRYAAKRSTLIITNRNKQELVDRLGEPSIDRLSEKGITLAFTWESYRKK